MDLTKEPNPRPATTADTQVSGIPVDTTGVHDTGMPSTEINTSTLGTQPDSVKPGGILGTLNRVADAFKFPGAPTAPDTITPTQIPSPQAQAEFLRGRDPDAYSTTPSPIATPEAPEPTPENTPTPDVTILPTPTPEPTPDITMPTPNTTVPEAEVDAQPTATTGAQNNDHAFGSLVDTTSPMETSGYASESATGETAAGAIGPAPEPISAVEPPAPVAPSFESAPETIVAPTPTNTTPDVEPTAEFSTTTTDIQPATATAVPDGGSSFEEVPPVIPTDMQSLAQGPGLTDINGQPVHPQGLPVEEVKWG